MKKHQFWCLGDPSSTTRNAWWVEGEVDFAQVTCPLNPCHLGNGSRIQDLSIVLPNKTVQDVVWTWMSECLIQDHVLDAFQLNDFTGFQIKPVRAQFEHPDERPPPVLWELVVTGWGGMAHAESGIKLESCCEGCGYLKYSALTNPECLLDKSQWEGSDFFMIWPMPRFPFITARVAALIRERRFTGVVLKPINRFSSLVGDLTPGFGPGRLSDWIPEERAKRLGKPLGID